MGLHKVLYIVYTYRHGAGSKWQIAHTCIYSRDCFLRSLLGAAKSSLKAWWFAKQGSLRQAHAKLTLSFPQNPSGRYCVDSCNTLVAVYTDISYTSLKFKVYKKYGSKLMQAYNKVDLFLTMVPHSSIFTC